MCDTPNKRHALQTRLNPLANEGLIGQIIAAFGLELDVVGAAASLRERIADIVGLIDNSGKLAELSAFLDNLQLTGDPGNVSRTVNVPLGLLSDYFVGRESILEELHLRLTDAADNASLHVLHGMGGMGKTQIALQYILERQHTFSLVLWASAESEAQLRNDFSKMAARLVPPVQGVEPFDQLCAWLQNPEHSGWLLVLDNVDFYPATQGNSSTSLPWTPERLKALLPRDLQGKILLTTRNKTLPAFANAHYLPLSEMVYAEARALMRKIAPDKLTDEEAQSAADELARELGYLPLALEQAAAYVRTTPGETFGSYLEVYRTYGVAEMPQDGLHLTDYPQTIQTVWDISFKAVQARQPLALHLLEYAAFLHSDDILTVFCLELGRRDDSPLHDFLAVDDVLAKRRMQQLLAPLEDYALVTILEQGVGFGLHRMVQAVMRHRLEIGDDAQTQIRERIVAIADVLRWRFPQHDDQDSWVLADVLMPHIQACVNHAEHFGVIHEATGVLLTNGGLFHFARGRYAEAEQWLLAAIADTHAVWGSEHLEFAITLSNLAMLYIHRRRLKKAEPLMLKAMEIEKDALGDNHSHYAIDLFNLAELYQEQGRWNDAESLMQQGLPVLRESAEQSPTFYATALNNLAGLRCKQKRTAEAESLYLEALEWDKRVLSDGDSRIAVTLSNLASLYAQQGQPDKAELLYQDAVAIARDALGENHSEYAVILSNLAEWYRAQKRYEEAEPLYNEALDIIERLPEDEPAEMRGIMDGYLGCLMDMGQAEMVEQADPEFAARYRAEQQRSATASKTSRRTKAHDGQHDMG